MRVTNARSPQGSSRIFGPRGGYCVWQVKVLGPDMILRASEIEERYELSFWDALIVTAALHGRAAKILSEDLNPGQTVEGVLIENPFAASELAERSDSS